MEGNARHKETTDMKEATGMKETARHGTARHGISRDSY